MRDPRVDVTIGANTTPFAAGLSKALISLRGFISGAAILALAKSSIDLGGSLQDMSNKAQVSTKWLQEVGYAAKMAGADMEDVTNAVFELRRAQAQALSGSGSDLRAFRDLGISVGELRSMGAEAIFDRIAERVRKTSGGLKEVNAAMAIMGRGGKSLVASMVDGMSEARAEAQRLGLVLSDETIQAMDKMGDTIDTIGLKLKALTAELVRNVSSWTWWKGMMATEENIKRTVGDIAMAGIRSPEKFTLQPYRNAAMLGILRQRRINEETQIAMAGESGGAGSKKKAPSAVTDLGGKVPDLHADQLARIGLFVGGAASNQMLGEQRRTVSILGQIHAAVRTQNDLLRQKL